MSAELDQQRLFELNALATRKRFIDDGKCAYCGIRARVQNLCVLCEERRARLAQLYPGASRLHTAQQRIAEGPTRLGDIAPPVFRQSHNSE